MSYMRGANSVRILRQRRGSLTAEMAIISGACAVVMIVMANICLFIVQVAQFDRITGEVARNCVYAKDVWSAQEGVERGMGLEKGGDGRVEVFASESGNSLGMKTVTFELKYRPLISHIGIGRLSVTTPVLRRTKTFAVPSIGYSSAEQGNTW